MPVSQSKLTATTLIALTVAALLIRLWGIDFGLPYEYHIDEHFYYPYAWAVGQGQLNLPDQAHGPSLYLAALLIGQKVAHALTQPELSAADFGTLIETDPWPVLLSGRVVSALAGALTVPIVYLLGRCYRNRRTGLIAAALMTVLFFHVRDSHFGVPDSFMTLFVAATGWLALRGHQTGQRRDFWLAGLCAGLAAATKYTSILVFVPVILAAFKIPKLNSPGSRILTSVFGCIVGFIVGYPNILINFPAFVKDISFLWIRVGAGFEGWRIVPDDSPQFYLSILSWGAGIGGLILAAIRMADNLIRRTASGLILISFPIVYFTVMSLSRGHFGRYMLPLLPFLAVLSADVSLNTLPELFKGAQRQLFARLAVPISFIALLAAFVPNAASSLRLDWLLSEPDTRTLAKEWIEANIEAGTRIAVEWPYHTPPLSNGDGTTPNSKRDYWIDLVWGFGLADRPIDQYRSDGTQFLIATNYIYDIPVADPQQEATRRQFYAQLPLVFHEVKTFSPRCDGGEPEFIFDQLYGPAIDLWNLCLAGPMIRIYQVNHS